MAQPKAPPGTTDLPGRHRAMLDEAVAAIVRRGHWSPFPESPKAYGKAAAAQGRAAFEGYVGRAFPLEQAGTVELVGGERSPYGMELGITYPRPDVDALFAVMAAARPAWRDLGGEGRAGVVAEILARLNARSSELAEAVMHTTGQ